MTRIVGAALLGIVMANHGVAAQGAAQVTEVMVAGEVQAPGHSVSAPQLTVRGAIARAGGFTANAGIVEIRRRSSGTGPLAVSTPQNEYRIQYIARADLEKRPETDALLKTGDFIFVRPDLYILEPAGKNEFGTGAFRPELAVWGVAAPVVLTSREPQYTRAGMLAKLQGTVDLEVVVKADGAVGDVQILKGLDERLPDILADLKGHSDAHSLAVLEAIGNGPLGLDANAVECVKTWTFTPGTVLGNPKPMIQKVSVPFKLR